MDHFLLKRNFDRSSFSEYDAIDPNGSPHLPSTEYVVRSLPILLEPDGAENDQLVPPNHENSASAS